MIFPRQRFYRWGIGTSRSYPLPAWLMLLIPLDFFQISRIDLLLDFKNLRSACRQDYALWMILLTGTITCTLLAAVQFTSAASAPFSRSECGVMFRETAGSAAESFPGVLLSGARHHKSSGVPLNLWTGLHSLPELTSFLCWQLFLCFRPAPPKGLLRGLRTDSRADTASNAQQGSSSDSAAGR